MSKKINTLSSGALVKLNENGVAKKFIFLGYNHYGRGEVILLRKDATGHQAYNGGNSGYNPYDGSQIDAFCDETFPLRLDPAIQGALVTVPIPTIIGHVNGTYQSTVVNLERKGFILSCPEVGLNGTTTDGKAFPYFSSDANRIAYFDGTSTAVDWWLRSPVSSSHDYAYRVYASGTQSNNRVYNAYYCPRPALALSSQILVSNGTDSEGCYTVDDAAVAGEHYQKVNGVWRRMM